MFRNNFAGGTTIAALFIIISFTITSQVQAKNIYPHASCQKFVHGYGICCEGKNDTCFININEKQKCYCDEHCVSSARNSYKNDCCPDYEEICKINEFAMCTFTGAFSKNRKIITQSGIKYECRNVNDESRISYGEILKTKQSSWSPRLYSTFEDKNLNDVVKYLGTKNPKEWLSSVPRPMFIADYIDHPPKKFDPRSDKTRNVSPIRDHGACGTSWMLSVVDVISDRLSLEIGDKKNVSAQQFIDCIDQEKQCAPGNPADAWNYSKENKLISEEFYHSTGIKGKCQEFDIKCEDEKCHLNKLYTVNAVVHFFNNYIDIMNEVYRMGPVQATMRVYEDFFFYGSGIYKCPEIKNLRQKPVGYHSVRIIGWSETDDKEQYWIVANSWGTTWGDAGYFKIAKGTNECDIEANILVANIWKIQTYKMESPEDNEVENEISSSEINYLDDNQDAEYIDQF